MSANYSYYIGIFDKNDYLYHVALLKNIQACAITYRIISVR